MQGAHSITLSKIRMNQKYSGKWKKNRVLTRLGRIEVIESIEGGYDDSICSILLQNKYQEFDDDITSKIFPQRLAKKVVIL